MIADFGDEPPFSNIRDAEARHIDALVRLFHRYGLPVPSNPWPGKVERFADRQAACEAGVKAEIDNGEMYDRLLAASERPDILTVLRNLQEASQQRHLPAFQRCAARADVAAGVVAVAGGGTAQVDPTTVGRLPTPLRRLHTTRWQRQRSLRGSEAEGELEMNPHRGDLRSHPPARCRPVKRVAAAAFR